MSEQLTGFCPNCGNKLVYAKNDATVMCYACDSVISVEEFSSKTAASAAGEGFNVGSMPLMMMGFDNPESGVVFVENFFDNYDWEGYAEDTDIAIPEIAEVVKTNKMKNGACATSWYLDYKATAYPVRKKIEGLAMLQNKMAKRYNPVDSTEAYQVFDIYRRVCVALKDAEKDIFKQLDTAIKYAAKFKLDGALLTEMRNDMLALKGMFEKDIIIAKDIDEIPAYVHASKAESKKIADELAEKGINAEQIYENAVEKFNDPSPNKNAALVLFEQIRGYGKSVDYIKKINQYFNFNGEVYRAFGKHFIYKTEDYTPTLDLKELKAKGCSMFQKKAPATSAEDAPQAVKALALYEIVDGVPAKEATIRGISQIITCYGSKLYYVKSGAGIHSFDIYTRVETCICPGEDYEFMTDKCKVMSNGSSFYMVKLYKDNKIPEIAKKGCSMFKGKKSATPAGPVENHELNPYCVIVVDMKSNGYSTIINEMAEFSRNVGDKIFYYYSYKPEVVQSGCMSKFKKVEEPEAKKKLMVCDMATRTNKEISEDCQLHTVFGDYIIYSMWKPNNLNKDLHAYNLETDKDVLIEKNIYNYFNMYDGKVYYTVGNANYCPLVRNTLDASDRIEVMAHVQNIICERGGWLYVQKGYGSNSLLAKVSADGKKVIIICTQLRQYVRIEGNYLYYVDIYNNLRVVRLDGKFNQKLAENINKIFPCEDGLYYTRQEKVSATESALSLYFMDKNGRNIKKMVFDVDSVQNDPDTNTIYHSKTENTRFKVYAPKQEDKATYEFHNITKYSILNKANGTSEQFLTLGWPSSETQTGCLKKKSVAMIYEEAPIRPTYEPETITDTTNPEDVELDAPTTSKMPGCIPEKSGCASIFGKSNLPNKGGNQSAKTKLFSKVTKPTAKSTPSAKSKTAGKADPKFLALSLVAVSLMAYGFLQMTRVFGHGPVGMPPGMSFRNLLFALIALALALCTFGVIPTPLKKVKNGKTLGIMYVIAALAWFVMAFAGMGPMIKGWFGGIGSSSGGDDPSSSYTYLYLDSETYVELSDYATKEFKIEVPQDGNYTLSISGSDTNLDIYTQNNGWTYYYVGDTAKELYLYSGINTISIRTTTYNWNDFYISISKMPTTIDVTENNTSEFNLSSGETQIARFYVDNSGEYLVKASNTSEAIRLCNTDNGNTYYLNSSNNWETVIDFDSGYNYYEISFEYGYAGLFYLGFSAYEPEIFAENATKVLGAPNMNSDNSSYVSVSSTDVEWFEFTAPVSGYYTFYLDSFSSAYMVCYTNEYDSGSEYYSSHEKYLNKGESYFVKVKGSYDYTTSAYFYVSGTGLTANNAYYLQVDSTYYISLQENGYIWFMFEDSDSYDYYIYVNGSEYTSTTVYNEYGQYTSNTGSYGYATYTYANDYFYVCVYAEYYDVDIEVTLYRNW